MKIHREGYLVIGVVFFLVITILAFIYLLFPGHRAVHTLLYAAAVIFMMLVTWFFRDPQRAVNAPEGVITSGADGKVVMIRKTKENEYFNDERLQVSVFMSLLNVHVNWFPASGVVRYRKHNHGSYLIASHPKSSDKNERTTVVLETEDGQQILFRQIAGTVARRIVCNAWEGSRALRGDELGIIRFGSRFDLFLPVDSELLVRKGQKVRGCKTPIARINRSF
ncbi:MAG: phosphatidylserine decarboxylase family protein [Bacteroidales bacterium]|nr:phosphatidylserine decarboxylase family protein [Bacteroidales bacterium]